MADRKKYKIRVEIINKQMETILNSSVFKKAKKLQAILRYLVEQVNAGKSWQLKMISVAIDVFDLDADLSPSDETKVRMQVGRLRQRLHEYYNEEGSNDSVVFRLQKGSYVPEFILRKDLNTFSETREVVNTSMYSIAVYPIANNGDESLKSICIGLSQQLIIDLSRFSYLNVRGEVQQSQYPDLTDLKSMSKDLGARFLLTGNITKIGDEYTVMLNLNDLSKTTVLWGDSYQFKSGELNALISSSSQKAVSSITSSYGVLAKHLMSALNVEQVNIKEKVNLLYSKWGREYTDHSASEVLQAIHEGLTTYPDNTDLMAIAAEVYLSRYYFSDLIDDTDFVVGKDFAMKAIEQDPYHTIACWSAGLYYYLNKEKELSLEYFNRCAESNPNDAIFINGVGVMAYFLDEEDLSMQLMKEANQSTQLLQPFDEAVYCLIFLKKGEFQDAFKVAMKINLKDNYLDPLLKMVCYNSLGRMEESKLELSRLLKIRPEFLSQGTQMLNTIFYSNDVVKLLTSSFNSVSETPLNL